MRVSETHVKLTQHSRNLWSCRHYCPDWKDRNAPEIKSKLATSDFILCLGYCSSCYYCSGEVPSFASRGGNSIQATRDDSDSQESGRGTFHKGHSQHFLLFGPLHLEQIWGLFIIVTSPTLSADVLYGWSQTGVEFGRGSLLPYHRRRTTRKTTGFFQLRNKLVLLYLLRLAHMTQVCIETCMSSKLFWGKMGTKQATLVNK